MQKKIDEIILSLSLMFTVFFFSSVEIYIDNKNEFVVEGKDIIIPLLITALAAAAINFAVLFIAGKIHPVLNAFIKCTELGAVLALYSQYMFFNGEMLNIGDDSFAYMQNDALINKNFTVFTVIFLLPAVITLTAVPLKKVKAKTVLKNMTLYISALVFVMQLAGLFGETVQNINKKSTADSEYYIAYEPAMSLSADGNVIVFIVDMLDGEWMETALVDYPE
ncbi:MAG: hypothetical protein IJR59_02855, partial [Firmicutes bacterium]|nr:hypothetical protein [Bacillota bacterium]